MKRYFVQLFFLLLALFSALAFKEFVSSNNLSGKTLISLGGARLDLHYSFNTGINFGLINVTTQFWQFILSALGIIFSLAAFVWCSRSVRLWTAAGSGLFAGGVLAHAYERSKYGGVFDNLNLYTNIPNNSFSFNLADIFIFISLLIITLAPRETHDAGEVSRPDSYKNSLIKLSWNFALSLALLISCLYASWLLLSKVDFLFSQIYNQSNLEVHINKYAPQNRNKINFELTTQDMRIRIFSDIAYSINNNGIGLAKISYTYPNAVGTTTFLVEAEREHLQDVANLVSNLKPIGLFVTIVLVLFYMFCYYYKVTRSRNFWQPYSTLKSITQIGAISCLCAVVILIMGPQRVFYLLHEIAFKNKSQWFFYYQDSLMTTLMPEIVFANIAMLIFITTVTLWVIINLLLQRLLK